MRPPLLEARLGDVWGGIRPPKSVRCASFEARRGVSGHETHGRQPLCAGRRPLRNVACRLRRRRHGLACSTAGRPLPNRKPRRLAHRCRRGRQRDAHLELVQRHGLRRKRQLGWDPGHLRHRVHARPDEFGDLHPYLHGPRGKCKCQRRGHGCTGGHPDGEPVCVPGLSASGRRHHACLDIDEHHGVRRLGRLERCPPRQRL